MTEGLSTGCRSAESMGRVLLSALLPWLRGAGAAGAVGRWSLLSKARADRQLLLQMLLLLLLLYTEPVSVCWNKEA